MLISLIIYMLTGGADFGGGIWDLFATGRRANAQRSLIAHAIGPIWEANHVWLIVIVVLLFVAFPFAFAAISTALHIPLTFMLIGIVLRGTAFVFRTYDVQSDVIHRRWSRVFAVASVITPVMLGVTLGAVASGTIHVDVESGQVDTDFISAWFAPFPFAIGFFTLTLCALLAAVYLTLETEDTELQEDFRRRALISAVSVGAMAGLSFIVSAEGAPAIRRGLGSASWSIPFHILTGAMALWAIWTIWKRQFRLARILVSDTGYAHRFRLGAGTVSISRHTGLNLFKYGCTGYSVASVVDCTDCGGALLVPAFWYLYAVFKGAARKAGQTKEEIGP